MQPPCACHMVGALACSLQVPGRFQSNGSKRVEYRVDTLSQCGCAHIGVQDASSLEGMLTGTYGRSQHKAGQLDELDECGQLALARSTEF